jgi:carboxylesterase type B
MAKTGCDWNDEDRDLAGAMNRYWINFAKHGHPNEAQPSEAQPNNTEQPHWPAWSETRKLMVFDRQPRIESDVRNQKLKALAQGLGLSLD